MGELAQSHRPVNNGRVHTRYRTGWLQKNFIPPSKIADRGGGRFQGVGAADAAMVVVIPNRLLWSKRVLSLRIPP